MKSAYLLAGMVLLALWPSAAGASPDSGPEIIGVSVGFDQTTQSANVTDQEPGTVTFTGEVSVDKLPVQRAVVMLESSVDTGWVSQVSPSTAVFTSTTPQSFTVTAVVPARTLSTLKGMLVVKATMNSGGLTAEDTANATITVDQYYLLNVASEAPYFETEKPGISTTYKVLVTNKGNGPDTFALEISNLKDLVSKHWMVGLDKEVTPVVQPGLYGEVTVTVTSPEDSSLFEGGPQAVIVNAASVGARTQNLVIALSFPLYFNQKAIDPVFDVTVPIIVVAVVVAAVAVVAWRWRKRRARKAPAAPEPDEPVEVEPYEKVADE